MPNEILQSLGASPLERKKQVYARREEIKEFYQAFGKRATSVNYHVSYPVINQILNGTYTETRRFKGRGLVVDPIKVEDVKVEDVKVEDVKRHFRSSSLEEFRRRKAKLNLEDVIDAMSQLIAEHKTSSVLQKENNKLKQALQEATDKAERWSKMAGKLRENVDALTRLK